MAFKPTRCHHPGQSIWIVELAAQLGNYFVELISITGEQSLMYCKRK